MKRWFSLITMLVVIVAGAGYTPQAEVLAAAQDDGETCIEQVIAIQAAEGDVVDRYRPLRVVDIHN
ncbi:MAG: hypothetical protein GYB65_19130, partial [Chloroflexi bacterium]|nr:hypothetical protein [Chloroflexota bacterium]